MDDMYIIELSYNNSFNPVLLDYNDFQFLMPPVQVFPPFNKDDVGRIRNNIKSGRYFPSKIPSGIVQAHLPNISPNNIVNVYPMFSAK